jgi:hypothetical protein
VGGGSVSTNDGVLYGAAHALVVVLRVSDVGALPSVRGLATAR